MKGPLGASKAKNARPASNAPTSAMPTERRASRVARHSGRRRLAQSDEQERGQRGEQDAQPGAVLPQVVGELVAHQNDVGLHFVPRKGDGPLPPDRDVFDGARARR